MCGIAGYYIPNHHNTSVTIKSMVRLMAHRGPDDEGFVFVDTKSHKTEHLCSEKSHPDIRKKLPSIDNHTSFTHDLALGHRRYSIIDLSSDGHQPMEKNGNLLIFNGEIYNYIELRNELSMKHGVKFSTNSDSEVILEAFAIWGKNCFSRFNGFFSIIIYSPSNSKLFFARDRVGKAPLYYSFVNGSLFFASEIRCILEASPDLRASVNQFSIDRFLLQGIRDYNNDTFWSQIHTFPAASYAELDLNDNKHIDAFSTVEYWQFPKERLTPDDISFDEACRELKGRLTTALELRLRSDIPVGFTLSGGLDSSALAALYSKNHSKPADFISVRYDNPAFDESYYASKVASTNPSVIRLAFMNGMQNTVTDELDYYTNLIAEPYHSPVLYTDYCVQKHLKSQGYGVMINGAAADELFAGYEFEYFPFFIKHLKSRSFTRALAELSHIKSARMLRTRFKIFLSLFGANINLHRTPDYRNVKNDLHVAAVSDFNSLMIENFRSRRMNYWLRSGNQSYMGVPLEPRMPFLDYNVIDFAFILPPEYLIKSGWHKYILRKCIQNDLPEEVVWRKVKMGFPFDLSDFLRKNKTLFTRLISGIDQQHIDISQLLNDYDMLATNYSDTLWRYLSLLLWIRRVVYNTPLDIEHRL